ncbi:hypothetical protein CK510_15595, partial [Brunnivagina elsteri CCALA 953]
AEGGRGMLLTLAVLSRFPRKLFMLLLFVGKRVFQPLSHKNRRQIFCMKSYGVKGSESTA